MQRSSSLAPALSESSFRSFRSPLAALRLGLACAVVGSFLGCKRSEDEAAAQAVATLAASQKSFQKSDHLAEGELLEGKEKAFALLLPRGAKVTYRFASAIHVEAAIALEPLANYIRSRVRDGNIQVGASETRFERVRVPEEPGRPLRIRIATQNGYSRIVIEDVTPPPDPTGSPAERMQQVGLTPDGKLLDPKKAE
jgi:hypothetical protein